MKTQVIMKRELFNSTISQQSKSGFISAHDLVKAGNRWRRVNSLPDVKLSEWLRREKTKEFMNELELQTGENVKISTRGRNAQTWLHPYVFIDLALYISPKLKVEVYRWLYDELLQYRNNSGDSYKKMTGALWENCNNKSTFSKSIIKTAKIIRKACNVKDWQSANEEQLKLRNKIHENIALLCDVLSSNNDAIRIGISKAFE